MTRQLTVMVLIQLICFALIFIRLGVIDDQLKSQSSPTCPQLRRINYVGFFTR